MFSPVLWVVLPVYSFEELPNGLPYVLGAVEQGAVMEVSEKQLSKQLYPMEVRVEGRVMEVSFLHS